MSGSISNQTNPGSRSRRTSAAGDAARRAALLLLRRELLNTLAHGLVWSVSAALVAILVLRLAAGESVSGRWWGLWWGWILFAVLVALMLSGVIAIRRRRSDAQGAGVLDAALGLKSQIRSAIELDDDAAANLASPGFVTMAQRRADAAASGIDMHKAIPRLDTNRWAWAAVLMASAIGAGVWLPARVIHERPHPRVVPDRAIASIDSIQQPGGEEPRPEEESAQVQRALDDLAALKAELARGVEDQPEADARAAAKLQQLAKALDDDAEKERTRAEGLTQRLAEAQNRQRDGAGPWDQRLSDFAESIRSQRYDEAQRRLEALRQEMDQMSGAERDALADELEELADAVEPDPLEDAPGEPQTQAPPPDDAGDEARDDAAGDAAPQPPETGPAERSPTDELADSMRDEADRVRRPPEQPSDEQSRQGESDQNRRSPGADGGQDQRPEPVTEPVTEPDPDPEQGGGAERQQQEQGQGQSPDDQKQSGSRSQREDQSPSERTRQGEPQEQESRPSARDGESQQTPEPAEEREQADPEQQQQGHEQQGTDRQGNGQQGQEQQGQGRQGQEQNQDSGRRRSLDETLREMQQQHQRARRDRRRAEEIRDQAQRLMEGDPRSDGREETQPRGVRPNEKQPARDSGGAGDEPPDGLVDPADDGASEFVPIDASSDDTAPDARPVGKWYAPEGESAPGESREAAQRLRKASEQAQRAVDQQQVPRKYRRVVREVFKRVERRADEIDPGSKIAPQGQDATPQPAPKGEEP